MLVNMSSLKAVSLPSAHAAAITSLPLKLRTLAKPRQSSRTTDQQSVVLFSGAVIQGRQFPVTIETLN